MADHNAMKQLFDLSGRVAIITGGGGLLGYQHAAAIAGLGAVPILLDVSEEGLARSRNRLLEETGVTAQTFVADITDLKSLQSVCDQVIADHGRIDILINNAARNPKVEDADGKNFSRLEDFPWEQWQQDLDAGLGGAFNCAKVFGKQMALQKKGVIINIASDLGVIAPDQRLYRIDGREDDQQPVKPVTYSVVKHGLIGLTKYLATYWCEQGVRCNALSPGGVYAGQDDVFVSKLTSLIPLGRMAHADEYRGAIAFLCADASLYMNGCNLVMDGGRSVW
ncbi:MULTISPECIES: SDR family oxidoreductase [unclassified Pseudomonas]|jgi:NAD(P)-dependent dehydrogenase (short-subunit alcohol dehydrogenase family)|uniref:SDR family oxidoreductase n=1 Tax=unclassified Pseudomonas TaxID=196821 RepID=UPI000C878C5A|nr:MULTISPECIES: SDR family oxidoreductase [unclassified Pseudomonas]PMU10350.1 oxidoreductase [Pseudomonas sp. FW305-20]PMU16634.1 oxidoreductase [Pseudomonas sp. FW305-122]PMU40418.1 oxidoreductase [Pseudomonas sp. FW305-47B]PMX60638.1 oxidoreductase [Pseudomonas sp. FW305-33]PMX66979.1 oxidoreductase [Pseudomonas sp. FW305-60]